MAKITVEVVYASASQQTLKTVFIECGSTIHQVILQSELLKQFPDINLEVNKVGVFGKLHNLDDIIKEGDRVEIYRPLLIDPKQARLKRVGKKKVLI